jgi:glycosyltransferase involved in cell wall biosynthesis
VITPVVSVVMGVFNGEHHLAPTADSILSQQDCELELIVVDDGSTDTTPARLLALAAADPRVRVIRQPRRGLTQALIAGCAAARGHWIARQDCGDVSSPDRLSRQLHHGQRQMDCVAVSCHTRFVAPRGQTLYCVEIDCQALNAGLTRQPPDTLRGPSHHGSVMMRRAIYEHVGGYRSDFYFAQDLDLWTRLVEHGPFAVVPDTLYTATLEPRSISATQTHEQRQLAELISQLGAARRNGQTEGPLLAQARSVRPVPKGALKQRVAQGNYFIGNCLRHSDASSALGYFREALANNPLHWRAGVRWLQTSLKRAGEVRK